MLLKFGSAGCLALEERVLCFISQTNVIASIVRDLVVVQMMTVQMALLEFFSYAKRV
jgi:hypothetical protein